MSQMDSMMNLTASDWSFDELVSSFLGRSRNADKLKLQLEEAVENTTSHEFVLGTRARVTRFIRSTSKSDTIAHNERIKHTLESTAKGNFFRNNRSKPYFLSFWALSIRFF